MTKTQGTTKAKVVKKKGKSKASARQNDGTPVHEKIIKTLLELKSIGIESPPAMQVCTFAGYSNLKSPGFAKAKTMLKNQGLILLDKGTISLTEAGASYLSVPFETPTSNEQVHERMKQILDKKTSINMFDALADGKDHSRSELMEHLGYSNLKSPGFAGAISHLKALGMVESSTQGTLRLADVAFPFGRSTGPTPATP